MTVTPCRSSQSTQVRGNTPRVGGSGTTGRLSSPYPSNATTRQAAGAGPHEEPLTEAVDKPAGLPVHAAADPRQTGATAADRSTAPSPEPGKFCRQRLTLYHPNGSGTGAAMQLEPRLNRCESDRYNCFFMEMAPQRSVAERSEGKVTPAAFDWEHKLTVKLDFADICEFLSVLEGRAEKLGGQRNGLFHRSGNATTVITLQKADKGGYFLGLSRKSAGDESAARVNMAVSEAEAIGLRAVFQTGLFFITFHSHMFQPAA